MKPNKPPAKRLTNRHGLPHSQLPPNHRGITNQVRCFRKHLEAALRATRAEPTVQDSAYVNSAVRHETRCRLLSRWLRDDTSLSTADRVKILADISSSSDLRDRAISKLNLKRPDDDTDPLTTLYRPNGGDA